MAERIEHRHTRGYLPHFDAIGFTQFVTFRLADSLPKTIFREVEFKHRTKQISDIEYYRRVEQALDAGTGPLYLSNVQVAEIVSSAILELGKTQYDLYAWVLMPNHAHILFMPYEGKALSSIMHSLKGYTTTKCNKILGLQGRFWSPDYFDRFIRDRPHFRDVVRYIEDNPIKANLCSVPQEWRWSSAYRGL